MANRKRNVRRRLGARTATSYRSNRMAESPPISSFPESVPKPAAKRRPRLLLFDIDGTLLNCHGGGMRAMRDASIEMFGPDFRWDGVVAAGNLDSLIYAQGAKLNGVADADERLSDFRALYVSHLKRALAGSGQRVEPAPGVHALLATVREREQTKGDVIVGMLTGNYSGGAAIKLEAAGMDIGWFSIGAFSEDGPDREGLVAHALGVYAERIEAEPNPRDVIVIGDTPRDIVCAKAHGCVSFAVATGGYTSEELVAHDPDHLVASLVDPEPLLALLD